MPFHKRNIIAYLTLYISIHALANKNNLFHGYLYIFITSHILFVSKHTEVTPYEEGLVLIEELCIQTFSLSRPSRFAFTSIASHSYPIYMYKLVKAIKSCYYWPVYTSYNATEQILSPRMLQLVMLYPSQLLIAEI